MDLSKSFRVPLRIATLIVAPAQSKLIHSLIHQIRGFNQEEEAFDWPVSQYPQCKTVQDRLVPYLRLYETAAEFQNQHRQWVNGPLSAVNPDKVEADVGNFSRSLYKLEKSFQDSPKALQIATSVKAEVEAFKEHIPLVQVMLFV